MAELTLLKERRSKAKGWVTRIVTEARQILDTEDPDSTEIVRVNNKLRDKYRNYCSISEEAQDLMSMEEFDADVLSTEIFERDIERVLLQLDKIQKGNEDDVTSQTRSSTGGAGVKLPKLVLKKFSGNSIEWPEFWDSYKVTVHDNDDITHVQKFAHLKSLMTGEAATTIASITLTEDNYSVAIDRLQNRYGQKKLQRDRLLTKLVSMSPVDKGDKAMREAVDELTATVRALQCQEITTDNLVVMMPLLRDKLPHDWKLRWAREQRENDNPSFQNFIDFLEQEMAIREDAAISFKSENSKPGTSNRYQGKRNQENNDSKPRMSASALASTAEEDTCVFCDKLHKPWRCRQKLSYKERMKKLRKCRACFKCGCRDHMSKNCQWKKSCHCGKLHIYQLCDNLTDNNRASVTKMPKSQQQQELNPETPSFIPTVPTQQPAQDASFGRCSHRVTGLAMRTVCVQIGDIVVRALCDTGATYTLISSEVAAKIPKKVIGKRKLRLHTMGQVIEDNYSLIETTASGRHYPGMLKFQAYVTDLLGSGFSRVSDKAYEALVKRVGPAQAVLADICGDESDKIGIIFGEDYYDQIVLPIMPTMTLEEGFKATPTIFGWMLHGGDARVASSFGATTVHVNRATVQEKLADFWELEHMGVTDKEMTERDIETEIKDTIKQNESGHYVLKWPWKENAKKHLALNKGISEARLDKLLSKMSPDAYNAYDQQIRQLEEEGHIELLPENSTPMSYLPHKGVVKSTSETTKLRIVFDASAKSQGKLSLNETLENGPNLLPLLWGILLRFRMGKVATTGDLEKAFLQMILNEDDRNACCFLWRRQGQTLTYRSCKVLFGAKPSPFMLTATLRHHLNKELGKTADQLLQNVYVDDVINSVDSISEAEKFCGEAITLFRKGGFNLRKIKSNEPIVEQKFGSQDNNEETKVLGVTWDKANDKLWPLKGLSEIGIKRYTKREAVSLLARIYDPLGLISPSVTALKCFTQDLWKSKIGWDEPLSTGHVQHLDNIIKDLNHSDIVCVDRWIGTKLDPVNQERCSIHVFSDASNRAYAAAAYIRIEHDPDNIQVTLLASKCRLGPPAGQTIPRMELLGALLGARLLKSLKEELSSMIAIEDAQLWTDSTIVLAWLEQGPGVNGVFVSNRVDEIRSIISKWSWVPTHDNPADLPTRGRPPEELCYDRLWWNGPDWLIMTEDFWPKLPENEKCQNTEPLIMTVNHSLKELTYVEELVDPTRSSRWTKTLRSLCWILKWKDKDRRSDITSSELSGARKLLFKQVQQKFFSEECSALQRQEELSKQSSIRSLKPILTDGLIRLGGRLQLLEVPFEQKHPILLRRCGIVEQLIQHTHEQLCHGGTSTVIVELRQQGVWILQAKKTVSSVIRSCRKCRRFIAAPASEITPPFPESRITCTRPFDTTGIDLGGPLYLKDGSKVWFTLFTCMSVRAIHLELSSAPSERALAGAMQRFMSRRGTPRKCISDHGTNFVALARWLKDQEIDIKWEFIVERAPWWGGAWERLVQTVKGLMKKSLGRSLLTWEQMTTLLAEVEKVVNRRPISYLWEGAEPDGIPVALTPEHFLIPPQDKCQKVPDDFDITEEFRQREAWMANLRKVWQNEYLLQVLGSKGEIWNTDPNPLQEGEVVLIATEGNRLNWNLGVIHQLHKGRDGRYRAATVKLATGYLRRPIQKLYKLELGAQKPELSTGSDPATPPDGQETVTTDNGQDDSSTNDVIDGNDTVPQITRHGRTVRPPERYGLSQ